ncbi:MAG: prepilin-type N-terminal cleavage/methylation domain-containing protein [Fimbriimonadaceae bacterium]|nr:prepilin-type N-terminal cleavage/methylation domain-containing protein [Fimbriimonadaceae bacterium]
MPTSATSTTRGGAPRNSGLTLVELLVVLAVIVVVSALVVPSLQASLATSRLRAAARGVLGQARWSRELAVQRGTWVRLRLDLQRDAASSLIEWWERQPEEGDPGWREVTDPWGAARPLPPELRFDRLISEDPSGEPAVIFGPDGRAQEFFVALADRADRRLALHVSATTGLSEILSPADGEAFEQLDAAATAVGP